MAYYATFQEKRKSGGSMLDVRFNSEPPKAATSRPRPSNIRSKASYLYIGFQPVRKLEDSYDLGKELGSGAFSVVKQGVRKSDGLAVAIKCIKRDGLSPIEVENLKREIEIMREFSHPHLVGLIDVFDEELDDIYLVTELVEGGELFDRIVGKEVYGEPEARVVVTLLLSTLDHLHSLGCVHRDIKAEK